MRLTPPRSSAVFGGLFVLAIALATAAVSAPTPNAPAPVPAVVRPGPGIRTLILVRHGAYDEDDPRDPDVGRALTDEGREQARLTGERLAAFPLAVDALHSSTMTRARQTAEIIGAALGMAPRPTRLLRECTPPSEREDIMARETPQALAACRDTLDQAWARFLRPSPGRDSVEVLVAHGNVIRFLTARALGLDPLRWLRMGIGHCSLTTIRVRADGSCQVVEVGDVGHLPPRLQARLWSPPAAVARPAAPDSAAPASKPPVR